MLITSRRTGPVVSTGRERRRHKRLPLELDCRLRTFGPSLPVFSGRTANISRGGVLLILRGEHTDRVLVEGATVTVEIYLPTGATLSCCGRVVRLERPGQQGIGVAVAIGRMELSRSSSTGGPTR